MKTCSDCKERERSWGFTASSGHCENDWCENFMPQGPAGTAFATVTSVVDLEQPVERQAFVKSWLSTGNQRYYALRGCPCDPSLKSDRKRNCKQPKITYFFRKI